MPRPLFPSDRLGRAAELIHGVKGQAALADEIWLGLVERVWDEKAPSGKINKWLRLTKEKQLKGDDDYTWMDLPVYYSMKKSFGCGESEIVGRKFVLFLKNSADGRGVEWFALTPKVYEAATGAKAVSRPAKDAAE